MVVGVLVLVAVGAPRTVVALVVAGPVVGWAAAAPLSVLLVVIAWTRRRAGRHTGGQVVLRRLVGAGAAAPALA